MMELSIEHEKELCIVIKYIMDEILNNKNVVNNRENKLQAFIKLFNKISTDNGLLFVQKNHEFRESTQRRINNVVSNIMENDGVIGETLKRVCENLGSIIEDINLGNKLNF